ncbi:MAG: hypothetical protein KIT88_12980, partial [Phycisphaeraceae bacterium]|nr:hypothetical protein [Phycisphaeraceae bacterium]
MRSFFVAMATGALTLAASSAAGQWTATVLHPSGQIQSELTGVDVDVQAGTIFTGSSNRAILWNGSPLLWSDITPAVATSATIVDMEGGNQVGSAVISGGWRAGWWNGTAASFVDLNPPGAVGSFGVAIDGSRQGGTVYLTGFGYQASLWTGTPLSWVNLHPAGFDESFVQGLNSTHQVGFVTLGKQSRAARWRMTVDTFVDLHPAGADSSVAVGMHSSVQVGAAMFGGEWQAGQWNNTADSFFNMHPAGEVSSVVLATHSRMHVGNVEKPSGDIVAALWDSATTVYENLHVYLPAHYRHSIAQSVMVTPSCIRVGGYAMADQSPWQEAVLWRKSMCHGDLNGDCKLDFFDVQLFLALFSLGDPAAD